MLPKQHTFSYIFALITHNIDTPVISELNKLNFKIAIICIYHLNTYK